MNNFSAAFNKCAVCREFTSLNFGIVPRGALSSKSAAIFIVNNLIDYSNVNNVSQVILRVTDEQIERDKI